MGFGYYIIYCVMESASSTSPNKANPGGLAGISAGDSAIATVGLGNGLNYRGYNVNELSEQSTFEEVYFLLLFEKLPNKKELSNFVQRIAG